MAEPEQISGLTGIGQFEFLEKAGWHPIIRIGESSDKPEAAAVDQGLDIDPYRVVLEGMPLGDTLGRPVELAKHPNAIGQLILSRAEDALTDIREAVMSLAHYASVAYVLVDKHPGAVAKLTGPEQLRLRQLAELIGSWPETPEREQVPITIKSVGGPQAEPPTPQGE